MLEKELGKNWKNHFEVFNEKPFAAASIGQVHYSQLKDGTELAMKIQYPGVKESIDSDLDNLQRLMIYTNVFPKTMFLDQLIAHTRQELHEECNYTIQGQKQIKMKELMKNDSEYYIPDLFPELSSQRILTSRLIRGDTLDFIADNYPANLRNNIGKLIMKLTLREIFQWRYMQTDPNPANFFFDRNTFKLNLIDFGAVHHYNKQFIDNYIEVVYQASKNNADEVVRISKDLGFLTGDENKMMQNAHAQSVINVAEPFAVNQDFDFGVQNITQKTYELMPVMLQNRLRAPPPQVYSLHRKLSGMNDQQ